MLAKWPIRIKLLIGLGLLVVIVGTLSTSGIMGLYAYRSLVRNLRNRAVELPLANELASRVSDLRVSLTDPNCPHPLHRLPPPDDDAAAPPLPDPTEISSPSLTSDLGSTTLTPGRPLAPAERFDRCYKAVKSTLDEYCGQLNLNDQDDVPIGNSRQEQATVARLRETLAAIADLTADSKWTKDPKTVAAVNNQLEIVQLLTADLPSFLHHRIHDLAGEVKTRYRTLIILTWLTSAGALAVFGVFIHLFYQWIFRPLGVLIKGSRYIARGNFDYRIQLDTSDEMAELARALNNMTARFQTIRDDLDHQVQLRTKQVVRSEQLASVGFLAAGVAHEINNPLASIAMCAESLESRLAEAKKGSELVSAAEISSDPFFERYLRMIQSEAFRCKEITEKLLDFSRMGDVQQQSTELRGLIDGVIEMVRHLGKYQQKQIVFQPGEPVVAPVNPQEIKQVVLNLITNGLDSLDPGGTLTIELRAADGQAELVFTDNGCGMTEEVLEHLFEPFFTRRRGGQGTGLGLSIVHRIISDHGGQIDATSRGPGQGSQFRVALPLAAASNVNKERRHRYQAA